MKKFILVFVFCFIVSPVYGEGLEFSLGPKYFYYTADELDPGQGLEAKVSYKTIYLWGSYESTNIRQFDQSTGNTILYGIGFGLQKEVLKGLRIYGQLGYYIPISEIQKDPQRYFEIFQHKLNWFLETAANPEGTEPGGKDYIRTNYNQYDYKIKSNFGGAIGITLSTPIYKNLNFIIDGGFRFLRMMESMYCRKQVVINPGIDQAEWKTPRNFNSGFILIGLNLKW